MTNNEPLFTDADIIHRYTRPLGAGSHHMTTTSNTPAAAIDQKALEAACRTMFGLEENEEIAAADRMHMSEAILAYQAAARAGAMTTHPKNTPKRGPE